MELEQAIQANPDEVSRSLVERHLNSKSVAENAPIIDISEKSDKSIFDILVAEKKKEILENYTETIIAKERDEMDREFMFGACFHLGNSTNNYAEHSALQF